MTPTEPDYDDDDEGYEDPDDASPDYFDINNPETY